MHTKRLYDDFKMCVEVNGLRVAGILTLAGLLVLPGYLSCEALGDKVFLGQALRYVYAADYNRDFSFKGSVSSIKRTLLNLKRFKDGIQLPYLSSIYNSIVFEDMVLPDQKIEYLYRLFTGTELLKEDLSPSWRGSLWGDLWGRRARGVWTQRAPVINREVELISTHVDEEESGGILRARVRLEMCNAGPSNNAEFFKTIRVPPGVLISGFSLKITDQMVPGQIFEKRTAL